MSAILTVTACGALIGIDERTFDTAQIEAGTNSEAGLVDTGARPDSSGDATADTGTGVTRPVSCGTAIKCNAPNETCCVTATSSSGGGLSYAYACTAALGGCPPGSGKYKVDCIDVEDCPPGQFCCGGYNAGIIGTYCKASQCGGSGGGELTTCDRDKSGQCGSRECRPTISFGTSGGSSGGSFPLPPPLGVCQ